MLKSCCPVPLAGEPDPPTPPQLSPGWASSPVLSSPSRLQPHQYSLLSSNTRQGRCCLGRGAAAPSAESCPPRHSRGSLTSFQPELDVSCPVRHPPCSAPLPGLRPGPAPRCRRRSAPRPAHLSRLARPFHFSPRRHHLLMDRIPRLSTTLFVIALFHPYPDPQGKSRIVSSARKGPGTWQAPSDSLSDERTTERMRVSRPLRMCTGSPGGGGSGLARRRALFSGRVLKGRAHDVPGNPPGVTHSRRLPPPPPPPLRLTACQSPRPRQQQRENDFSG